MFNSVGLTASMRATLSVLQSTQAKMDRTQQVLATGLKIASALDGPTAFFAAKGLSQRARDLTALKDAMGQAISTIKAADKGITAIQSLVEQARGLATAAYGSLGDDAASVATRQSLASQFNTLLKQIDQVVGDSGYGGKNLLAGNGVRFDSTGDSRAAAAAITGITEARTTNANARDTYTVKVGGSGDISGNAADITAAEQARGLTGLKISGSLDDRLGNFGDITIETRGTAGRERAFTISDGGEARTVKYFDNSQSVDTTVTQKASATTGKTAVIAVGGTIETGDSFQVAVAGKSFVYTAQEGDTAADIVANLAGQIGNGTAASGGNGGAVSGVSATADATTGKLTLSGSVARGDFTVSAVAENARTKRISETFASGTVVAFTVDRKLMEAAVNGGNGLSTIEKNVDVRITATNLAGTVVVRDGNTARGLGKLADGENAFAFDTGTVRLRVNARTIRDAADAEAATTLGTLQVTHANTSNDLNVQFNENNTSNITVLSRNVSTGGQGLRLDQAQNGWMDRADIDKAMAGLDLAMATLRGASQALSTNLSIITTRETFTKELADVLQEGADKLVLADQNEEAANMLMLQTRQQLAMIALSLANQSQQAILRLF